MASEEKTIKAAQGVELVQVSLYNAGALADRRFVVKTLRSPESWNFATEGEATARFDDEVAICKDDEFVQRRLNR